MPLVVGLGADFPTVDKAELEVDRLGLRVRINCTDGSTRRVKFDELAEYYLKVEFDPEVTASPKSENTKPILEHYVGDILIATRRMGSINSAGVRVQRSGNRNLESREFHLTSTDNPLPYGCG